MYCSGWFFSLELLPYWCFLIGVLSLVSDWIRIPHKMTKTDFMFWMLSTQLGSQLQFFNDFEIIMFIQHLSNNWTVVTNEQFFIGLRDNRSRLWLEFSSDDLNFVQTVSMLVIGQLQHLHQKPHEELDSDASLPEWQDHLDKMDFKQSVLALVGTRQLLNWWYRNECKLGEEPME